MSESKDGGAEFKWSNSIADQVLIMLACSAALGWLPTSEIWWWFLVATFSTSALLVVVRAVIAVIEFFADRLARKQES